MMIGGAVVNALAITGGNYLFSMLGRSGEAEKERKRHDLAIEELQRTESEYRHKRQLRLDYLNQRLRAEQHSAQVFEDVDAISIEHFHFLQCFDEWANIQVVVVEQPVCECRHSTFTEYSLTCLPF